jgi:hypothetical protein
MMSFATSAVWSRPDLSHCCTEHGQRRGVAMSGHITTVAISKSGQLGRRCTVAACPHVLRANDSSGVRRLGNVRSCLGNTRV